jgi:ATP synthase I chain
VSLIIFGRLEIGVEIRTALVFALVGVQLAVTLLVSAFCYLVWDGAAGVSLLLGGLSYTVPTLVSVLLLKFFHSRPAFAGAVFLASEILKIILAGFAAMAVFYLYGGLREMFFIVGLLLVSHLVFLLFLKVYRYGK